MTSLNAASLLEIMSYATRGLLHRHIIDPRLSIEQGKYMLLSSLRIFSLHTHVDVDGVKRRTHILYSSHVCSHRDINQGASESLRYCWKNLDSSWMRLQTYTMYGKNSHDYAHSRRNRSKPSYMRLENSRSQSFLPKAFISWDDTPGFLAKGISIYTYKGDRSCQQSHTCQVDRRNLSDGIASRVSFDRAR